MKVSASGSDRFPVSFLQLMHAVRLVVGRFIRHATRTTEAAEDYGRIGAIARDVAATVNRSGDLISRYRLKTESFRVPSEGRSDNCELLFGDYNELSREHLTAWNSFSN